MAGHYERMKQQRIRRQNRALIAGHHERMKQSSLPQTLLRSQPLLRSQTVSWRGHVTTSLIALNYMP